MAAIAEAMVLKKALFLPLILSSACTSWGKFWDQVPATVYLTIAATTPAANSVNNITQVAISLTVSDPLNVATISINDADENCSGSVQLSVNDFATCIRIASFTLSADLKTIGLLHTGIPNGQRAKIRITTQLKSTSGITVASQQTTDGFSTINPPCGAGNCYVYLAGGLGGTLGAGSHLFKIQRGTNKGNYLIVLGGSTNTRLYNSTTTTTGTGIGLNSSVNIGAHTMSIASGTNAGLHIMPVGGALTASNRYDSNNESSTNGPTLPAGTNTGSHSVEILTDTQKGKFITILANGGTGSLLFDPAALSFTTNTVFTQPVSTLGPFSIWLESGIKAGSSISFRGSGSSHVNYINPTTQAVGFQSVGAASTNTGSGWFQIRFGTNKGKFYIQRGGTASAIYDPASDAFTNGPISSTTGAGSCTFGLVHGSNRGKGFITHGGALATVSFYDPEANTYSAGNILPATTNTNDVCSVIEGGLYPGSILFTATNDLILYFP